jgi:hypothetical protein
MGTMLLAVGEFLVTHYDLVNAIMMAIDGGATKEGILQAIRGAQVAASEAAAEAELGPRPAHASGAV